MPEEKDDGPQKPHDDAADPRATMESSDEKKDDVSALEKEKPVDAAHQGDQPARLHEKQDGVPAEEQKVLCDLLY